MSAQPQDQHEPTTFAPLAVEMAFTCHVEVNGVRGPLEIKAHSMNEIRRVLNLLKQNGMLHPEGTRQPQPQASSTNGDTPPLCPVHNRAMKPSKKPGAWYCSAKVGEGYCDEKVG